MSAADIEDVYELSPLQQGLLYLSSTEATDDLYLNQRSFLLNGPLDAQVLEKSWQAATAAHTSMRTSFHWDGLDSPVQVVHRDVATTVAHLDWSDSNRLLQDDSDIVARGDAGTLTAGPRLRQFLSEDLNRGFDVETAPLQRVTIIRLAATSHLVVWTHHLLVLDGWSVPIFLNDVLAHYHALAIGEVIAVEPPPPYRDYIAWLQGQSLDAARTWWEGIDLLDAATAPAELSTNGTSATGTSRRRIRELSRDDLTAINTVAASHKVTLNTVLQAAWALTLEKHSGNAQVCFGVSSSSRPPELPGADRITGLLTNTLPLHVTVPPSGDVGDWLRDIQRSATAVRRFDFAPLADIKKWVGAPGLASLFHTLLVVDNYSLAVGVGNLGTAISVRPIEAAEQTSVPIVFTATPGNGLLLQLIFRTDALPGDVASEILTDLAEFLIAMTRDSRIETLTRTTASDVPQVAHQLASGKRVTEWQGQTLPSLLARQFQDMPDAPAILDGANTLSYADLKDQADAVANGLRLHGVGPGDTVAVCLQRSSNMAVAIVGITMCGAAYLPIEPDLPTTRIESMLRLARAAVLVTETDLHVTTSHEPVFVEDLITTSDRVPLPHPEPGDPAYVIFTSGSTGLPKGVVVSQAAVVHRLAWAQDAFGLSSTDRVLQKTPYGFDVSVWEFFWPLLAGASIFMARPGGHQDASYLARTIAEEQVSVAHFVPSMLRLFLDEPAVGRITSLTRLLCSGEALPHSVAVRAQQLLPNTRILNLYGPTEAAIDVTWWDCSLSTGPTPSVPIGQTPPGVDAYVLDARLRHASDGVPGELYLAGVQLADGYISNPALTASTFVADPFGRGTRMYRTGDRVNRSANTLNFLGRTDSQVKVHGYRIELSEVESCIRNHSSIVDAAVVHDDANERLAAFATTDGPVEPSQIREHLRQTLPSYMVPATIQLIGGMPLTRNGKLDKKALLSDLDRVDQTPTGPVRAAEQSNGAEGHISAVFANVLGLPHVDPTASFFDLGGNSFDAVRAIRQIDGATVGLLGAFPSPRALSRELAAADAASRTLLALSETPTTEFPLLCVPFGGGSAITYRPLADALGDDAPLTLYALAQPGHELVQGEDPVSLDEAATLAVEAALRLTKGPVPVYGHCAGVALAVEIAHRLEEAGREVPRLFLAASYPFTAPGPVGRIAQRALGWLIRCGLARVGPRTVGLALGDSARLDQAEFRYLRSLGGFDASLQPAELTQIMKAFRHDVSSAGTYFSTMWSQGTGPAARTALRCPITVITGADDPLTPQPHDNYRLWERFGTSVDHVQLPGGHYFHQEHPAQVAEVILRTLASQSHPPEVVST